LAKDKCAPTTKEQLANKGQMLHSPTITTEIVQHLRTDFKIRCQKQGVFMADSEKCVDFARILTAHLTHSPIPADYG
jgi:hypothetical protein